MREQDGPLEWSAVRSRMPEFDKLLLGNEIFRARTRGVGVLAPDLVHAYGVSGPVARASGVDFDLRRDEPYLSYGELLGVLTNPEGFGRIFTRTFGRQRPLVMSVLEPVRDVRNKVFHFRDGVTVEELETLLRARAWLQRKVSMSG